MSLLHLFICSLRPEAHFQINNNYHILSMELGYDTLVNTGLQLCNARWTLILFMSISSSLLIDLEGDLASLDRPLVTLRLNEYLARAQLFPLSRAKDNDFKWQFFGIFPVDISYSLLEIDLIFWNCCNGDSTKRFPVGWWKVLVIITSTDEGEESSHHRLSMNGKLVASTLVIACIFFGVKARAQSKNPWRPSISRTLLSNSRTCEDRLLFSFNILAFKDASSSLTSRKHFCIAAS